MKTNFRQICSLLSTGVLILIVSTTILPAQTRVEPGFNLFSVQQDVEIGRQSAAEAERQLPILRDSSVQNYVNQVGQRLAAAAQGPDFPYQFKVVNASDVNAFALPGGFMYVNRGLIQAAANEGELAGVLAHEMAHVALRHGTNQASKAYLAQAGLGILGGLLGGGGTGQIIGAIGGFGLNAVFLKFSRSAEEQADVVGAQTLAKAGYDPMAMASFFEKLREMSGRDPGKVEQFFSSHPAPANRAQRIQEETKLIGSVRTRPAVGGFESVQTQLNRLSPAPSMRQLAEGGGSTGGQTARISIERPSSRFETFRERNGFFQVAHPENWTAYQSSQGLGVTIVPEGGVVNTGSGQQSIIYGVIVNHYEPFSGRSGSRGPTLEEASQDLVQQIAQSNPYLSVKRGSERREVIDGANAFSIVLAGRSPVTGQEERVTVFTRALPDGHVLYALFIAPGPDYAELSQTFQRMISSLDVNDRAAHR